jgi:putative ABC transport system substrate-binding protein
MLWNPDFAPNLERLKSTRDAAGPLGLTLVPAEARGLDALEQAFATMIGDRAQALTVLSDGVLFCRDQIGVMAVEIKQSAVSEYAEAGLLRATGLICEINFVDPPFRRQDIQRCGLPTCRSNYQPSSS